MINQLINTDMVTVLENAKQDIMKAINCVQVGIIESFDKDKQSAIVRIAIKQIEKVDDNGTQHLVEHPLILECPVIILAGANAHLTFPIAAGDSCIVFFNDRDIDNWYYDGGVKAPNTNRKHDICDCFALVGVRNLQGLISNYFNGVELKFDNTSNIQMFTNAINTFATLLTHTGNMLITGGLQILGNVTGYYGTVNLDGNLNVDGYVKDDNSVTPKMQDMRDLFNRHTHSGGSTPDQRM